MRSSHLLALATGAGTALSASTLLSGGTIIAFDQEKEALDVIRDGALLVTDDRIAGLYETATPPGLPADTEVVDCRHNIISPGFIDTHRHGWQTALKTLSSNTSLIDYFLRYMGEDGAAATFTPEDIYLSQLAGLLEALNAGVTTTLDHAHHIWTRQHAEAGLRGSVESGSRVYWSPAFRSMSDYQVPQQTKDYREWVKTTAATDGLTTVAMAYDFWSQEPQEHTQAVVDLAKELHTPVLTIHWLGSVYPIDNNPEVLQPHGLLNTDTAVVFSHATGLTPLSAALLRATNQFISITPESEMHYGHSHFNAHLMQDQAALGVDTHFTFSTDMVTQARLWLQRTRSRLYDEVVGRWEVPTNSPMSASQAFLMATRQGALALRRDDLGVVRVGAKADLVVFDGRSPGMLGWNDPVAAVILHANVGDMVHVLVDGRFRKRDGKLTHEGYDDVAERFLASAERLQAEFISRPAPRFEGFKFGGCGFGRSLEVDTQRGEGTGYGESLLQRTKGTAGVGLSGGKGHDEL